MSFETLAKSLATLAVAHGLAAAPAADTRTPEQIEADEAAAELAKSQAAGEGLGVAAPAAAITLTLEDGTEVQAFDGGEMLKALGDRMDDTDTTVQGLLGQAVMLLGAQSQQIADLTKSFGETGVLVTTQAETITALRADLDVLRNQPAGRMSVANPAGVSNTSPLAKSLTSGEGEEAKGMAPTEFLAKCLSLQKDGKLSLQECAIAEAAIGSNVAIPDGIRTKVFSHK